MLRDGWHADKRRNEKGEIMVQANKRFNTSGPKVFQCPEKHKMGGAEVIPENVKIELNIPNIPSELAYALWSTTVGSSTIAGHPLYIDNAYVHLPDFTRNETLEILAYSVLNTLFNELKGKWSDGQIKFTNDNPRHLIFGGERLTKGAQYLLNVYSDCPIGNETIGTVFDELRREIDLEKFSFKKYNASIRLEVSNRLDAIGYWGYIPIPIEKNKSKDLVEYLNK